jgi:hypothetical protein
MVRSISSLGALLLLLNGCGGIVIADDGPCENENPCGASASPVNSCGSVAGCFSVEDACGETVWCLPAPCQDGCCGEEDCCGSPYPTCNAGDMQVISCPPDANCYEVPYCNGESLICQVGTCNGDPICDPGDYNAGGDCPPDANCYSVSSCGNTILCIDDAMPTHGCPLTAPSDGQLCDPINENQFCDYPTSPQCFESYACGLSGDVYQWRWIGGGCEGGG